MPSLVSIDLETTGLDPRSDAIIEIGAVRFNGARVEAEWSTLVNPGRPIPGFITQLTGISNEMVRNAPPLRAVLHDLVDFAGDMPVVGHNVRFDLGFLQQKGILPYNQAVDTYELAAVLMPTASRYNLGSLGQILGILIPNSHRALDDARLAHAVYYRLFEKALELPINLIAEFVRLSESMDWDAAWTFRQVLLARSRQPITARRARRIDFSEVFAPGIERLAPSITPNGDPKPIEVENATAYLEHGGAFSRFFESFEFRPQQVEMARAVCAAFNQGNHLLVEAGTGTGKSFAYLVPAALWARQNNTRVVVSTNTINLQDQLIQKDIPDLCSALGIDLQACVLKGRANYLCPRRVELIRQRGPDTPDEMRILAKVMVWLEEGGRGDRNEINLNGPAERDLWMRLSAEDEGCNAETCPDRGGGNCPFYHARMIAQGSHLVVVNHALLLADALSGNRVLPEYDYLIVDEGHHIEAATTSALSYKVSHADVMRMLRELGGSTSGLLARLLTVLKDIVMPADLAAAHQLADRITDLAFRLEHDFRQFFLAIDTFLEAQRSGQAIGVYGQNQRILPATRTLPAWTDVEIGWDSTGDTFKALLNHIAQMHKSAGHGITESNEQLEDALGNLGDLFRRMSEAHGYLQSMIVKPEPGYVYWAEISPVNNRVTLQAAPLHVGPLMEQFLWHDKSSVVLTSATLTTQGEFDYIRSRLNADEADELVLGSPFDYESAAMLYLCNDIPEPNEGSGYQRAVEQTLVRLSKATGGRLLALFTSYAQLKRTSQAIAPYLAEADITVYEQGEGASANMLLETFRESERAVLLGTKAFWEGVDIPGDALSVLVIVKLPFDVPTEPIIAARSETFDDPFNEYNLPEAILRFRQGFGRLIRTQADRGVVAVLDRRLLTKRYGRSFLESLPVCKVHTGSMRDLPAIAARWLNL